MGLPGEPRAQAPLEVSLLAERLIIGHRGAAGLVPENTLPSFIAACELGVAAVELDVHYLHGHLVVIHDETLNRTTSGDGPLASLDLAELRALDAGGGHPIPFLAEVFEALPPDVGINVELKGAGTAEPLWVFLREGGRRQRDVLVSSFNLDELRRFAELARGGVKVAPLVRYWSDRVAAIAAQLGAWSVNLNMRLASLQRIGQIHGWGCRVLVFTVNDARVAQRLFAWGADGIITGFPDRMIGSVAPRRA